jgi:hypothetical protein
MLVLWGVLVGSMVERKGVDVQAARDRERRDRKVVMTSR